MNVALANWQDVDRLHGPLLDFLDFAERVPQHLAVRQAIARAAGAVGRAVDVGCGLGLGAHELAAQGWRITGVDLSAAMIAEARQRYPDGDFRVGSALSLPFEDGSLDLHRSEKLWIVLPRDQLEAALAEARRVLRPGGKIVLGECDVESVAWTCCTAHRDMFRAARTARVDALPNGRIGSEMPGLLRAAGFEQIEVEPVPQIFTDTRVAIPVAIDLLLGSGVDAGVLTEEQAQTLREELVALERRGAFQLSQTFFVTSAVAP